METAYEPVLSVSKLVKVNSIVWPLVVKESCVRTILIEKIPKIVAS